MKSFSVFIAVISIFIVFNYTNFLIMVSWRYAFINMRENFLTAQKMFYSL